MVRRSWTTAPLTVLALLAGCGPSYSPDTYNAAAVQQANQVTRGVVIGVRKIEVSADGVIGAATGAAAGGVAGAQAPGGGVAEAFGAIGGGLVGGLIGNSVEHATGDVSAYEYVVRESTNDPKTNNSLVSVTQKDTAPLKIGTKVLVIAGKQARIVPDYTVNLETPPSPPPPPAAPAPEPTTAPPPPPVAATPLPALAAPSGPTSLAPPPQPSAPAVPAQSAAPAAPTQSSAPPPPTQSSAPAAAPQPLASP